MKICHIAHKENDTLHYWEYSEIIRTHGLEDISLWVENTREIK